MLLCTKTSAKFRAVCVRKLLLSKKRKQTNYQSSPPQPLLTPICHLHPANYRLIAHQKVKNLIMSHFFLSDPPESRNFALVNLTEGLC